MDGILHFRLVTILVALILVVFASIYLIIKRIVKMRKRKKPLRTGKSLVFILVNLGKSKEGRYAYIF